MNPALVAALLSQGLQFWADFSAKAAAGTIADADMDAAAAHLDVDLVQFEADIATKLG